MTFPSPVTPGTEGKERGTEHEEDNEGDDAHLWGWKPAQHINCPYWSHGPGAGAVKAWQTQQQSLHTVTAKFVRLFKS